MASEEESAALGEEGLGGDQGGSEPPPPPNFPNGRKPSTGTDIGFEESTSGSELAVSEALAGESPDSSVNPRESVSKRTSKAAEDDTNPRKLSGKGNGKRLTSNSGSILKNRESMMKDGNPPRKQWGAGRSPKGLDGVDLDNPDVKELLRRLSKTEASSSSSGGNARFASPKPGEHHRGIKALHRAVQENELPMRMAYEQLNELATNAERVKFAIERNRSLLTLQVKKANERILCVAFMAWSLETEYQKRKKLQSKRARLWSKRGLMSRAFRGWSQLCIQRRKMKRFEASAVKILQRRKLVQTWKAWTAMIREIGRKNEEIKKEKRLRKSLHKQFREGVTKRAIQMIERSQLHRYFRFFQEGVEIRRYSREFLRQVLIYLLKKSAFRAFVALRAIARQRAKERAFLKDWVTGKKNLRRRRRGIFIKLACNMLRRAFHAYVDAVSERRRVRAMVTRQLQKTNSRLLRRCFQAWISFMQMGAQRKMQRFASGAERENEKLRSENERLSTIIDTGDWNKDRVSDLVSAQQVLSAERIALTKLIGHLQRQHQQALDQQEQQELEIRNLKEQLMSGENNYFQRNKLLVKGASSFNTLMRVMKHDMLKRGTTPELLYEVKDLAMDQVSVFPDGELHVKAVKPRNKGKWSSVLSHNGNTRTPLVISNKPHTPRTPLKPEVPDPPPSYTRYLYT